MLRHYSRRSQSPLSTSGPPALFSSNLELFDGPDPDRMDGELEQARLRRAPFYRRLQAAARRRDDDSSALYKYRKSPEAEAEVADDAESSLDFEPHSSWRFYSSFDNGEWRRHAVPVLKVKDSVDREVEINGSARRRQGVESMSVCEAAESGLRRARQSRTTAAELQQRRVSMRATGCLGDGVSNRRVMSCSMESFRGIASGAGCPDTSDGFDHFARDAIRRRRRSLSPGCQPIAKNDVTVFDDDVTRDDFLSKRGSPFEGFALTGSVKINGVETKLEDKIIVPTKYKSTATGNPKIKISAEHDERTSANDVISKQIGRKSVTSRRSRITHEPGGNQNPSCMTGYEENHPVKTSRQSENFLPDDKNSEKPDVTNKEQNKKSLLIYGRKFDAAHMREELTNDSIGLKTRAVTQIGTHIEKPEEIDQTKEKRNSSSNPLSAKKEKVIITSNKAKSRDDDAMHQSYPGGINSGGAENCSGTPCGVSSRGEIEEQKLESEKEKLKSSEDCPEEKIVKFVSVYFANVNCGQKSASTAGSTANTAGTAQKEVPSKKTSCAEKKAVSNGGTLEEPDGDDDWVVEMAVRD